MPKKTFCKDVCRDMHLIEKESLFKGGCLILFYACEDCGAVYRVRSELVVCFMPSHLKEEAKKKEFNRLGREKEKINKAMELLLKYGESECRCQKSKLEAKINNIENQIGQLYSM